jgi:protein-S-isoprenylcysteine O-methyltransferase Ste14
MKFDRWSVLFLVGFLAYVIIRGVFEQRNKNNEQLLSRAGGRDRFLILIMAVGGLLLPILYLFTPWLRFADYRLPTFLPWIGAVVMVGALFLFWRSHSDLGENWSRTLEIRKGHQLVTHGIYRRIRHPMYAAIWLFSLAQGLLLQNWLAGWSAFAAFAVMYFLRISEEERMMDDFFGEKYSDYKRQTGRLFPRIRG